MLLAYLDESHTSDYYYIAALVVPEHVARPLTKALNDVVAKAADAYAGIAPGAELHGHKLFHGTKNWQRLKGMIRPAGVYNEAFERSQRTTSQSSFYVSTSRPNAL